MPAPRAVRPLLVYDGDCGFCTYWVRYWQALTGERVEYRPYQEAAGRLPDLPEAEFRRAVQYLAPAGTRAAGAEASFLVLSQAEGRGLWLALYRRLPGFAALAEAAYALIAAHRPACHRLSLMLWGRDPLPPRHDLAGWLFLRLLGLIALAAFVSFATQAQGLIGHHGILPLSDFVERVAARSGAERYLLAPMLFWWDSGDGAIRWVCWGGAAAGLMLALGLLPRLSLGLIYVLYLSLLYGGQAFMTYQWDTFLLETAFLALVMTLAPGTGRFLLRWLLFRFMFMSGVVKLASGDPSWRDLTALSYHFLTQPLPTPLAWHAARLAPLLLRLATGATFVVELGLPFLIFAPRRPRFLAAAGIVLLESLIALTGNYNWFNLQTILLCLLLLDDRALRRVPLLRRLPVRAARAPGRAVRMALAAAAAFLVLCSLVEMAERFGARPPALLAAADAAIEPFHLVNPYGLFAVMTKTRDEIVIEGSNDGFNWRPYEFRYKPGDPARRPPWSIPHQPRLDWQMWFAALDDPRRLPWFWHFLERLLENEPSVTALLARNPFPDAPPRYVRAQLYDYRYATPGEHASGLWWDRRLVGSYVGAVALRRE